MSSTDRDASAARDPLASGASIGSARADESPQLVTRGETQGGRENASALVDWLGFTLRLPAMQGGMWLEEAVQTLFRVPREGWISSGKGWYGYTHHLKLGPYGFLAFGGATQKETYHVGLNAHGCAGIQDWNAVQLWGDTYSANITRVDLAHDDFGGETVSVAAALKWLHEGLFDNQRPSANRATVGRPRVWAGEDALRWQPGRWQASAGLREGQAVRRSVERMDASGGRIAK